MASFESPFTAARLNRVVVATNRSGARAAGALGRGARPKSRVDYMRYLAANPTLESRPGPA